jgi:hypothetical protein
MKFGYPSKKKVEKFKESCYSFVTCWNLLFKYGNFRKKISLKSGNFVTLLSQKSYACVPLDYFGVN